MRTVGGKKGRRYSQRTAAVAPEASPKWPPPSRPPPPPPPPPATARYRYRRRGPSSRERQSPSELKQVSSGTWASLFPGQPISVALLRFTRGWFPDSFQTPLPSVRKRSRLRTPLRI
ncbi:LOW QUALITY PROTEIN: protein Tob1 [Papio anubis]|uniref:LOW QUALITY PROTEIN: protein Tob1 n=1 Tax=Papio anubis TaxID=9555 RepID=UPI0012ADC1D6|nr:LOW QUALITY PROTEIN: protein Tob1 [Papio anubis]